MRILVVGAGAIGGYFGGRLLQAGRDVTFLVRPKRASELATDGLVIKSPNGDVTLKNPQTVQADEIKEKFDVVLLSCKAFDLDDAIKSFAPAVGSNTAIVPMLNGMNHLETLDERFGAEHVLALVVELVVGGVEVLRALLLAHRARAEAEYLAAHVGEREHDARAEAVVGAAVLPFAHQLDQVIRSGDASRVRGQDPICARLHRRVPS